MPWGAAMAAHSSAVFTMTAASTPSLSATAVRIVSALSFLFTSKTALPLFSSVVTFVAPSSPSRTLRSAMARRLALPTLMPRQSAMQRMVRAPP